MIAPLNLVRLFVFATSILLLSSLLPCLSSISVYVCVALVRCPPSGVFLFKNPNLQCIHAMTVFRHPPSARSARVVVDGRCSRVSAPSELFVTMSSSSRDLLFLPLTLFLSNLHRPIPSCFSTSSPLLVSFPTPSYSSVFLSSSPPQAISGSHITSTPRHIGAECNYSGVWVFETLGGLEDASVRRSS
ncbi:hypothetical protein SCHPADRAFT_572225 [Schizopora paradoxa]|uniref:Uncharacterized protein n=1 Tax=Schizopora paradoxa TaxID=27342 RepID=A0A0H2RIL9_9AGAM|nr:hypothetical protein SCHPADRAFT_572225 [Schizopora paradoxa]